MTEQTSTIGDGPRLARRHGWLVLTLSALAIVPCLWHRHIEAGDLGSHVYNAWLAQLIGKGQAPGLYTVWRWNNVLFDLWLLHVANFLGLAASEKIVVSACVLIFFWGVFALVSVTSGRAPWMLTPCIAMLAYGYSFNMGFMNYYLSIGLGCFCLALLWPHGARKWMPAVALAVLVMAAHPMGLVWVVGVAVYLVIRPFLPGAWKLVVPLGVVVTGSALRWYIHRPGGGVVADFYHGEPFQAIGVDQLVLYGSRYEFLGWAALILGMACFVLDLVGRQKETEFWKRLAIPLELCLILFCAASFAPENVRFAMNSAWVGLLVARLTTISAIGGLCVLGCMRARRWHLMGFAAVAVVFFVFLYQDTGKLNLLERNAEKLVSETAVGTRVIPNIYAERGSRIQFITHIADRACVGRCFVYSNYEPSSKQFRVRVAKEGSSIVSGSPDDANDMQGGGYEIQKGDLPLKLLYQSDPGDWTKLSLRDLSEGESTGGGWFNPPE